MVKVGPPLGPKALRTGLPLVRLLPCWMRVPNGVMSWLVLPAQMTFLIVSVPVPSMPLLLPLTVQLVRFTVTTPPWLMPTLLLPLMVQFVAVAVAELAVVKPVALPLRVELETVNVPPESLRIPAKLLQLIVQAVAITVTPV